MGKYLQDRVTVITGAGAGIGRAIALQLAAAGARTAVTDVDIQAAQAVAQEIRMAGGEAASARLDVTDTSTIREAVHQILGEWGRIDVWVNNAGVSSMNRFLELSEHDWDFNMDINAKGAFFCSQAVVRQMLTQPRDAGSNLRGKIINIASMAGKRGNAPYLAHYVASKFAVIGLTQALAGEFAAQGITVNAVCPGYVNTSMQEREAQWEAQLRGAGSTPQAVRQLYVNDTPLGRLETPEDVSKVVLFLASGLSDFITGEAINVNGGSWMD